MKGILTLLMFFTLTAVFAQMEGRDSNANVEGMAGGGMFRSFDNRFKGIEGYPTLMKHYCPGEVMLTTGRKVKYDSVNVDAYNNELLIKSDNLEKVFIKKLVAGFSLETPDAVLYFTKLKDAGGEEAFYEVLVSGKVKLFKRNIKNIEEPTNTGVYSPGRLHSVFEEKVKYFYQKEDAQLIEVKSKKALLTEFSDLEESISKFMKENRTSLKDEKDVVKLFEFISSL